MPDDPAAATRTTTLHLAVLGEFAQRGHWQMRRRITAISLVGGVDLDLTDAALPDRDSSVIEVSLVGGVKLKVPTGFNVAVKDSTSSAAAITTPDQSCRERRPSACSHTGYSAVCRSSDPARHCDTSLQCSGGTAAAGEVGSACCLDDGAEAGYAGMPPEPAFAEMKEQMRLAVPALFGVLGRFV